MKSSVRRLVSRLGQQLSPRPFALVSLAALASACSGEYPLGATSTSLDLAADDPSAGETGRAADTTLPITLGAPDFTIGSDDILGPDALVAIGDIDGDGYDETAQSGWDIATGASSVHIRYGGPRPRDAAEVLAFDHGGGYLTFPGLPAGIARAGDVDGDGYGDVLFTTDACNTPEPSAGAYLVYGGPERLTGAQLIANVGAHFALPVYETSTENHFCHGITPAFGMGDLDGDGIDDLVVSFGPRQFDAGNIVYGVGEGSYVYYGRPERFAGELPPSTADAVIQLELDAPQAYPIGDVTGDGLSDLFILSGDYAYTEGPPAVVVPGRAERWSGSATATDLGVPLPGVTVLFPEFLEGPTDLDGDGVDDLLLRDAVNGVQHVFYGGPELLAEGFDLARADAVQVADDQIPFIYPVGDLDADGDTDLVNILLLGSGATGRQAIALQSGSSTRLAGGFAFPESEVAAAAPDGPFPGQPDRVLTYALAAGDLDGDGADDVFTTSELHIVESESSFRTAAQQIHVYYGKKAALTDTPR